MTLTKDLPNRRCRALRASVALGQERHQNGARAAESLAAQSTTCPPRASWPNSIWLTRTSLAAGRLEAILAKSPAHEAHICLWPTYKRWPGKPRASCYDVDRGHPRQTASVLIRLAQAFLSDGRETQPHSPP